MTSSAKAKRRLQIHPVAKKYLQRRVEWLCTKYLKSQQRALMSANDENCRKLKREFDVGRL